MNPETKHILILSSWYPTRDKPFLGNFIERQARLLSERFKITVLHTHSIESVSSQEIIEQKEGNFREIIIYYPKSTNLLLKRVNQQKAFKTGLSMIEKVDFVHGHVIIPKGHQFVAAKKHFNCPLFVTEHASYYRDNQPESWHWIAKIIFNRTKKNIDRLFAVSDFLKQDMVKFFDRDIEVLTPYFIDTNLFIPDATKKTDQVTFLHVSTLDVVKNAYGIIDACSILKEAGITNFKLKIISDELYYELSEYAMQQNVAELVQFIGPQPWHDLIPYYQKSSAFILNSDYETFSIVLIEAFACGLPVISTPVGIANNLPRELGIQTRVNVPSSVAAAMEEIINEKSFDNQKIRSYALDFSKEKVLDKITTIYN